MRAIVSRRALLGAGAGAAVAAVSAVAGASPARAAPVDEVLVAGPSESYYQTKFEELVRKGYRPYIIDGWEGQDTRISAIFRPIGNIPWRARHGMTGSEYQADFDAAVREGWRLTNVTSYQREVDGQWYSRYASIWELSPGPPWVAYHGISRAQHQLEIDKLSAKGYTPINLSCVRDNDDVVRVTGLYHYADLGSWRAKTWLTADEYQQISEENWAAGRHTSYVNVGVYPNEYRFSAIWHGKPPGSGDIIAHHGIPFAGLEGHVQLKNADGYLTRSIAGYMDYGTIGDARFAAIWRRQ
ncbi:MAG TPA: hypothetical protein VF062_12625 [Candidatus Limnocylindrales bacterium]